MVGPKSGLYKTEFWVSRVNYISGKTPHGSLNVQVKIRYQFQQAEAKLVNYENGVLIRFHEPQRSITPGQAAVFYQDDLVLGGGIIEGNIPEEVLVRLNANS